MKAIYMVQERRQRALCAFLRGQGSYAPEAAGASPVDLHHKADQWPDVFQPLDGKPQTDGQLGSGGGGMRCRNMGGGQRRQSQRETEETRHICESKATSCSMCSSKTRVNGILSLLHHIA